MVHRLFFVIALLAVPTVVSITSALPTAEGARDGMAAMTPAPRTEQDPKDGRQALKIGVVDLKICMKSYEGAKDIEAELGELQKKYAKDIQVLQGEVGDLKQKVESISETLGKVPLYWEKLSLLKQAESTLEFRRKFMSLHIRQTNLQRLAEAYGEIQQVVTLIAKEQKYDLVLRIDEPMIEEESAESVLSRLYTNMVMYHGETLDITEGKGGVVDRLNQEYMKRKASLWECPKCKIKNTGPECTQCRGKRP